MNWIIFYSISGALFFLILIIGSIFQKDYLSLKNLNIHNNFYDLNCNSFIKNSLNELKLNKTNLAVINKNSNCFNYKYNVIKISEKTSNSASIFCYCKCANLICNAKSFEDNKFIFKVKQLFNLTADFISKLFFPIILICAIFNSLNLISQIAYIISITDFFLLIIALIIKVFILLSDLKISKNALTLLNNNNPLDFNETKKAKTILSSLKTENFIVFASNLFYIFKLTNVATYLDRE